jgi:hypothetical protein
MRRQISGPAHSRAQPPLLLSAVGNDAISCSLCCCQRISSPYKVLVADFPLLMQIHKSFVANFLIRIYAIFFSYDANP